MKGEVEPTEVEKVVKPTVVGKTEITTTDRCATNWSPLAITPKWTRPSPGARYFKHARSINRCRT